MANIIISRPKSFGRTRSEQERNLREEGFGSSLTEEQLDKCRYIEKKLKDKLGSSENFANQVLIDSVK